VNPLNVAAEVLGVDVASLRMERIKSGLTNESWCVESSDTAVVVRISTVNEAELQLDRDSETHVLKIVEQLGIGAPVLLCEPARRLLVTRYLPGQVLSADNLREPAIMQRVAQLLRRLHGVTATPSVQHVDLVAVLHGYWNSLDAHSVPLSAEQRADRNYALSIADGSVRDGALSLCHNDVHHLNIVDNGERLWLLDWEYAGRGDAYFDLASVCSYHDYSESQRDEFLHCYDALAGVREARRLERMCWLFDYIRTLWLTVREHAPKATV
jgi:thiamine kinase